MPIHDFKGWAKDYIKGLGWFLDLKAPLGGQNDLITRGLDKEAIGNLTNLLIKAYDLGKNPHVEKLDK
jgi:hypothetical protein